MTSATRGRTSRTLVGVACLLNGCLMLIFGVWALLLPASFAAFIDFPPYNEHLLHDLGAFQIGIGVTLCLALFWPDAIAVALVGFIAAGTIHVINHSLDHELGGHAADAWGLALLVVVAAVGLIAHLRSRSPTDEATRAYQ
jgi:predicted anti-sigma-YlaC factor YlaD